MNDLKTLFLLAAIPSFISVLLIFFFIQDTPPSDGATRLRWSSFGKNFHLLNISNLLFSLGFFSYSFLLLFLQTKNFALVSIPIYYLIFSLSASLFSWASGRLADQQSRRLVIALSYLAWAGVLLGFIFIPSLSWLTAGILFALYGAHKGGLKPAMTALVAESAPSESRASALGIFKMLQGLAALPASFLAGLLWDFYGSTAPFIFALGMLILAFFVLFLVKETREETREEIA